MLKLNELLSLKKLKLLCSNTWKIYTYAAMLKRIVHTVILLKFSTYLDKNSHSDSNSTYSMTWHHEILFKRQSDRSCNLRFFYCGRKITWNGSYSSSAHGHARIFRLCDPKCTWNLNHVHLTRKATPRNVLSETHIKRNKKKFFRVNYL